MLIRGRVFSRRTPVFDHAGVRLFHASREKAQEMIDKHEAIPREWTGKRIVSLRMPTPYVEKKGEPRRRQLGLVHKRETYTNPPGVWTLDQIPELLRRDFRRVLMSIREKTCNHQSGILNCTGNG